ncbi:hypothetical protein [Allomesorhizobium alhagi]|uniref:hypothetical protein n=1 Tax=Allomesorhizobium alhagi TaxID=475067 RepID=UPI00058E2AB4|nr:hypothetical protein [Mesorhizobium alhagi]
MSPLDRLVDFHRERAFEPTRETAFRVDRADGPHAGDVHWPLDHVEIAPGMPCAMGPECHCTMQMAKSCEWKALSQAALPGPLYGWVEKVLLGSIILLGVVAFAAGYSWGAI